MTIHSDSVRTTEVVLLAQPGVSAFHLSVPLAIFGMCFEGRTEFRVRVAVEGSGGPTSHCLMIRGTADWSSSTRPTSL